jgi:hypothetical protein
MEMEGLNGRAERNGWGKDASDSHKATLWFICASDSIKNKGLTLSQTRITTIDIYSWNGFLSKPVGCQTKVARAR